MLGTPLHHFYLIEGDEGTKGELLEHLLEVHNISQEGNPDFLQSDYESFGIEESRGLKDFFSTKAFNGDKKVAVVTVFRMTRESQNALLKLSEEPAEGQHLIIIVPSVGGIIDTLKSRAQIIRRIAEDSEEKTTFLSLSIPERLKIVQKIITKKDKEEAVALIDSLVSVLKDSKKYTELAEVYRMRSYIMDQSSSLKLILEHLSLILPIYN